MTVKIELLSVLFTFLIVFKMAGKKEKSLAKLTSEYDDALFAENELRKEYDAESVILYDKIRECKERLKKMTRKVCSATAITNNLGVKMNVMKELVDCINKNQKYIFSKYIYDKHVGIKTCGDDTYEKYVKLDDGTIKHVRLTKLPKLTLNYEVRPKLRTFLMQIDESIDYPDDFKEFVNENLTFELADIDDNQFVTGHLAEDVDIPKRINDFIGNIYFAEEAVTLFTSRMDVRRVPPIICNNNIYKLTYEDATKAKK